MKEEELVGLGRNCEGVIAGTEKYTEGIFRDLPKLCVISRCGVGTDSIDKEAAGRRNVIVKTTPDAPTEAVAELTLSFILMLLRRVCAMNNNVKVGIWKKEMGALLTGKTVGVIGLGRIGKKVVELLNPFRCTVLAYDAAPDERWAKANDVRFVDLETLLKTSDVISIHISHEGESSHNFINSERFKLMKRGAILINTSRGGLIDEEALYKAVKEGRLGGAALDTMEKEPYIGSLRELENVVLTPHIGSYALESRIKMENESVKNLLDALGDKK